MWCCQSERLEFINKHPAAIWLARKKQNVNSWNSTVKMFFSISLFFPYPLMCFKNKGKFDSDKLLTVICASYQISLPLLSVLAVVFLNMYEEHVLHQKAIINVSKRNKQPKVFLWSAVSFHSTSAPFEVLLYVWEIL